MKCIFATKEEMSQIFDKDGNVTPVTVLKTRGCVVTYVKTQEKDGYNAIQLGFGEKRKLNKPLSGHLGDLGNFLYLREVRVSDEDVTKFKRGDLVEVTIFSEGDRVRVSGMSKGKGFQGVVKRHGFHGGPRTHGQKHSEREPGSIGATGPQRVFKGTRMAGRMGGSRVTVKNLRVMRVLPEEGKLYISGAVPGRRGTLIEIQGV